MPNQMLNVKNSFKYAFQILKILNPLSEVCTSLYHKPHHLLLSDTWWSQTLRYPPAGPKQAFWELNLCTYMSPSRWPLRGPQNSSLAALPFHSPKNKSGHMLGIRTSKGTRDWTQKRCQWECEKRPDAITWKNIRWEAWPSFALDIGENDLASCGLTSFLMNWFFQEIETVLCQK